ncbi:MAG: hypothetical protein ACXWJZ_17115 [Burkholderiaceae bacterium]
MTWNYRVMELIDVDGEPYHEIREVYYDDDGNPNGYVDHAADLSSVEGIAGLAWVLVRMREALEKPILREGDFSA